MTNHNSPQPTEQPEGEIRLDLTHEDLIRVLKGVSLIDLTGCEFENGIDQQLFYVNAISGGRVVDAISWDGNVFRMMNNDESFDLLNPMIEGFKIAYHLKYDAEPLPSQPARSKTIYELVKDVEAFVEDASKHKEVGERFSYSEVVDLIVKFNDRPNQTSPQPIKGESVDALAATHLGIAFAEKHKTESEPYNSGLGYGYACGYQDALASHPSPPPQ